MSEQPGHIRTPADIDQLLLPGFKREVVDIGEGPVLTLQAGAGPPILLLHGDPQTHLCWHRVAPHLTDDFTVVLTDLRGRGETHKPSATPDHHAYSKREMAAEQLAIMKALNHDKFHLVGHDRGGRVARRLALDHHHAVRSLTCLDIVPALDLYEGTTAALAQQYFYFYFLTQPHPQPEQLIAGDPTAFIRQLLLGLTHEDSPFHPSAFDAYLAAATTAQAIEAMCECFRAGYTTDIQHDRADRAEDRRITAPTLVLYGEHSVLGDNLDIARIWSQWADTLTVQRLKAGHFLPEETPDHVAKAIRTHIETAD